MDFSLKDNEWIVGKNTDKLNTELFGTVNEPHILKRSRRRKRKVEISSLRNTLQNESCQVSLQTGKSSKKHENLNKDHPLVHNLKRKKKCDKLSLENAHDHDKYQKFDGPIAISSELLTKKSSKLDCRNKLKRERTRQTKFHKQNSTNDATNLHVKKRCNIKNNNLLQNEKFQEDNSNDNKITNCSSTKKRKSKKKDTIFVQNNLQDIIPLDNESPLPRLPNSNKLPVSLKITKLKHILKSAEFSHNMSRKLEKKERKKGMLILQKGKRKEYSDILNKQATDKLKSAHFRFINEKMYTVTGKESMHLFKLDPDAFEIYHDGFQAQVDKWPINPVDIIIDDIGKKPNTLKIADFGCGTAKIAQAFPDRKVYSFDLISMNSYVTVCDMANVPLAREAVNIVIFCLALMGTNLNDYLCEAHRVLKMGGQLKIAEVISRIENVDTFINDLKKFGFTLSDKNISHKMFIFLDFKKTGKFDWTNLPTIELKPCLYKKR